MIFSPLGVKLLMAGAYSDAASGDCDPGGNCQIAVIDTTNPSVFLSTSVSFSSPTVTLSESTSVLANYLDKVTAKFFPVGDSVTAQECDWSVDPATTLASACDPATAISGTVGTGGTGGTVAFNPTTKVSVKVGGSYVESGSGTVVAGGTADIVINDSTTQGVFVVTPITLAP